MQALKYYLTENPVGTGFMAKTIVNNNYNVNDFLKKICQVDSSLDFNNVKAVLKALNKAAEEVLSEGNSITVSEFLRIMPVIKGTFESIDSSFNPANNYIGIACTVLPTFIRDFQSKVSVEKTGRPANMPQIFIVRNNRDNENVLRLRYANKIFGINFTYPDYKLKGIKIINPEDKTKTLMLDRDNIDIMGLKAKELHFNIDRDFTPPGWLTDEMNILVQLSYENTGMPESKLKESDMFDTVWDSRK